MPDGFAINCIDGWFDITDDLASGSPWSLARPHGYGAFQISVALYQSGANPNPSTENLCAMVCELLSQEGMGPHENVVVENGPLLLAAASCRWGGDFVRAWYVSDGRNFAKITYTSAWGTHDAELPDCEQM